MHIFHMVPQLSGLPNTPHSHKFCLHIVIRVMLAQGCTTAPFCHLLCISVVLDIWIAQGHPAPPLNTPLSFNPPPPLEGHAITFDFVLDYTKTQQGGV